MSKEKTSAGEQCPCLSSKKFMEDTREFTELLSEAIDKIGQPMTDHQRVSLISSLYAQVFLAMQQACGPLRLDPHQVFKQVENALATLKPDSKGFMNLSFKKGAKPQEPAQYHPFFRGIGLRFQDDEPN